MTLREFFEAYERAVDQARWDAWLRAWDDVGRYAADCMLNPDDFVPPGATEAG